MLYYLMLLPIIALITLSSTIVHYKIHLAAMVELNSADNVKLISPLTTANIKPIEAKDQHFNKTLQDIASAVNLKLPTAVILNFHDQPQNIAKQLDLIAKTNGIKEVIYSKQILLQSQNLCYIMQHLVNMLLFFILILTITINLLLATQYNDHNIKTLKQIIPQLLISLILAMISCYFLTSYIVNLIKLLDKNFTFNINHFYIIATTLISATGFAILQLLSIKIYHKWINSVSTSQNN